MTSLSDEILESLHGALRSLPVEALATLDLTPADVELFFQFMVPTWRQQLAVLDEDAAPAPVPAQDDAQDLAKVKERTEANLRAMAITAQALRQGRALTEDEKQKVLLYSGWGGLSIERNLGKMPPDLQAEAVGLIHEYYTPTYLAAQIARLVLSVLPSLDKVGTVRTLEPSAGIGRFVQAVTASGFDSVRLFAVEMSPVSAAMLRLTVPPAVTVYEMPFEEFVTRHPELDGQLDLVLSNPPYGHRGSTIAADRNYINQDRAYFYFMERALGLLRLGGLGVFLVPYGFLNGKSKEYRTFREKILLRHHLAAAYRLPSSLFPGAKLVTDVLIFRSRGGQLQTPVPTDQGILEGRYFAEYPAHLLGIEQGTDKDKGDDKEAIKTFEAELAAADEKAPPKPRWGYQVEPFRDAAGKPLPVRLPEVLEERPFCFDCELRPVVRTRGKVVVITSAVVETAVLLGRRIGQLQAVLARGDDTGMQDAQHLHAELLPAIDAWLEANGNPYKHQELIDGLRSADSGANLNTFLQAFDRQTVQLVPALRTLPPFTPRFTGSVSEDAIDAQGRWFYRERTLLLPDQFAVWHRQQGGTIPRERLVAGLIAAGWAWDRGELLPPEVYYSGYLWPKYDRARAYPEDPDYQRQLEKLTELINPVPTSQFHPHFRDGWIPIEDIRAWMQTLMPRTIVPELERNARGIGVAGIDYNLMTLDLADQPVDEGVKLVIGAVNDDAIIFQPAKEANQSIVEARREFLEKIKKRWDVYLDKNPALREQLAQRYNRLYRGYIAPSFSREPLNIARWGTTIKLNAHQDEAAQAFAAARRGLLCFTVGVGKTFTGCAIVAKARQEGWAKRPVILVPNNLLITWVHALALALPTYRVGMIGSERVITRDGSVREQADTSAQRAQKWRAFQRGEYDVMLVTFSMLRRTALSRDLGPIVGELMEYDENLKVQLEVQARARLKMAVQKEKSRGKQLLERQALIQSFEGRALVYPKDGGFVLSLDGEATRFGTRDEADAARRQAVVKLARTVAGEKLIEKAAKSKNPKKTPGDVLDAVWKRALIDGGYLQVDSLSEQERAEENEARKYENTSMSERSRAIASEANAAFAARFLEPGKGEVNDPDIYWDELGVDLFVIDEVQNFKNRDAVANRSTPLMYLGAISQGSKLAWQLYFRTSAVRRHTRSLSFQPLSVRARSGKYVLFDGDVEIAEYDKEKDAGIAREGWEVGRSLSGGGGIFGLSGTPVKNSPVELYVQLTYVAPDVMRRVGIKNIFNFLERYLQTEPKTVITPKLSMESRDAVVGFKELEELRGLFYALGIYKTPQDVGLKVPEPDRQVKLCQKTEVQKLKYRYYSFLYKTQQFRPYVLGLQIRMQLVGIHPDLDGANLEDLKGLVEAIQELRDAAAAKASEDEIKRIQADIKARMSAFFGRTKFDGDEAVAAEAEEDDDENGGGEEVGHWTWDNADQQVDVHSPKLDACADQVMARPGCGHIMFVNNVVTHKWMRRVLIERGMPPHKIAILNAKTGDMKARQEVAIGFTGQDELQDADGNVILSGLDRKFDVVIANSVANEGLNLQRETCMLHHLDLPWEPATLEQRNGCAFGKHA